MTALTLLEASKLMQGEDIRQAVVEIFAQSHPLLAVMPFEPISGNAISFNREGTLPTTAFRAVNAAYTANSGVLEPVTEKLFIAGGDIDVDRFIVKTMGEGQRTNHESMKLKALSHSWAYKFIKGDNQTTVTEFDGMQARCLGDQLVPATNAGTPTNGGDLIYLSQLDAAIDAVVGPTHLLMSRATKRAFSAAFRGTTVASNIQQTRDDFGRPILTYNGLPIITMDDPDQQTASIAADEADYNGTVATCTSIYVVALGDNKLTGIQNGAPDVEDLGELQTAPVYRTRMEWYAGICQWSKRPFARYYSIKSGATVAA